jgi:hypothetical protein
MFRMADRMCFVFVAVVMEQDTMIVPLQEDSQEDVEVVVTDTTLPIQTQEPHQVAPRTMEEPMARDLRVEQVVRASAAVSSQEAAVEVVVEQERAWWPIQEETVAQRLQSLFFKLPLPLEEVVVVEPGTERVAPRQAWVVPLRLVAPLFKWVERRQRAPLVMNV